MNTSSAFHRHSADCRAPTMVGGEVKGLTVAPHALLARLVHGCDSAGRCSRNPTRMTSGWVAGTAAHGFFYLMCTQTRPKRHPITQIKPNDSLLRPGGSFGRYGEVISSGVTTIVFAGLVPGPISSGQSGMMISTITTTSNASESACTRVNCVFFDQISGIATGALVNSPNPAFQLTNRSELLARVALRETIP
jgi:hypothetical protein